MKLVLATVIGACGLHSDTVNGLNATFPESVGSQGCQGDPHMPMGDVVYVVEILPFMLLTSELVQ